MIERGMTVSRAPKLQNAALLPVLPGLWPCEWKRGRLIHRGIGWPVHGELCHDGEAVLGSLWEPTRYHVVGEVGDWGRLAGTIGLQLWKKAGRVGLQWVRNGLFGFQRRQGQLRVFLCFTFWIWSTICCMPYISLSVFIEFSMLCLSTVTAFVFLLPEGGPVLMPPMSENSHIRWEASAAM